MTMTSENDDLQNLKWLGDQQMSGLRQALIK